MHEIGLTGQNLTKQFRDPAPAAYLRHLHTLVTQLTPRVIGLGGSTVKAEASQQGNDTSLLLERSILGDKPKAEIANELFLPVQHI